MNSKNNLKVFNNSHFYSLFKITVIFNFFLVASATKGVPGGIENQVDAQSLTMQNDDDAECQMFCSEREDCKYWMRSGVNCYTYSDGDVCHGTTWCDSHRYGIKGTFA